MLAINHALTGALIGLTVQRPVVAIPTALLSHFVCDAIPHYGTRGANEKYLASSMFKMQLITDMLLCITLVGILFLLRPADWFMPSLCAFIATSPDLAWLPGYLRVRRGKRFELPQRNWLTRFTGWIQWFEQPIGGLVELAWALTGIVLLLAYL